jgi:hypothetical protein
VAAVRDLEFDAYAYGNVLAYNMLTALYLVLISRTKASTKLSTFGMMQYNNLVCIPALAGLCLVDGSFAYVRTPRYYRKRYYGSRPQYSSLARPSCDN